MPRISKSNISEALNQAERSIKKATDRQSLRLPVALLHSLLSRFDTSQSELTSAARQLCTQLASPASTSETTAPDISQEKKTAQDLVRMAKIAIAASSEVSGTPVADATLERDVWGIITDRYFRSWPFYVVMGLLASNLALLGFTVEGALVDAEAVQDQLEKATTESRDAVAKFTESRAEAQQEITEARAAAHQEIIDKKEDALKDIGAGCRREDSVSRNC